MQWKSHGPLTVGVLLIAGLFTQQTSANTTAQKITQSTFQPTLVTANATTAQTAMPTPRESRWVALDTSQKPGTEAMVKLNSKASNASRTVFDLIVPGFWIIEKYSPDGKQYQQIDIPGIGSHDQRGAPDLPLYRFNLAAPLAADAAKMSSKVLKRQSFPGINVWPQPIPELDGEKDRGTPEQFVINQKIYSSDQLWPGRFGKEQYRVGTSLRNIPTIQGEAYPVQWNPATGEMIVAQHVQYVIEHDGQRVDYKPMTQERFKLAEKHFLNWNSVTDIFVPNFKFYTSSFLVIYPDSAYEDEIKPFVDQKKARGFAVTELTVADDIGASTCTAIRNAIKDWENHVPWWHDAYALLVGDTDVIPHCTSPTGDQTDDLYASTNGDDLNEEIYLGRLSVDSEADLSNQISKILTYEDNPSLFCCYDQAGLWAHKENAPGKYEGAHEAVRTFAYANPPSFITYYGSQPGVTDADVRAEVDGGVGVLAYRGHGSSSATATSWNQTSQYFDGSDVNLIANPIARSPVVWGFACTNSKLDVNDSIGELWMERADAGASSYYGATRTSYTSQNHELDKWMFRAVYDEGLTTQSHAIERAESQMAALSGSDNAWMYLLLGDPDMQIRTRNPLNLVIKAPEYVEICKFCDIQIQVLNEVGNPIPNALVGLWKAGEVPGPNIPGETWTNGYTDSKGVISLNYSALTTGEMLIAVEDDQGNALLKSIRVMP